MTKDNRCRGHVRWVMENAQARRFSSHLIWLHVRLPSPDSFQSTRRALGSNLLKVVEKFRMAPIVLYSRIALVKLATERSKSRRRCSAAQRVDGNGCRATRMPFRYHRLENETQAPGRRFHRKPAPSRRLGPGYEFGIRPLAVVSVWASTLPTLVALEKGSSEPLRRNIMKYAHGQRRPSERTC